MDHNAIAPHDAIARTIRFKCHGDASLRIVVVLPTVRVARPDAVIVDIVITGVSGYAVAQEIRHSFTDLRPASRIRSLSAQAL